MGLGNDLIRKMDGLLRGPYDPQEAAKVGNWIEANFRVKLPRTPRGQKALKQQVNVFLWALRVGGAARESQVRDDWAAIKPQVPDLVRYFSDEGITNVPKEIKSGPVTYLNWVGLDAKKLQAFTRWNTEVHMFKMAVYELLIFAASSKDDMELLMLLQAGEARGMYAFIDICEIVKKHVRTLDRKRAQAYQKGFALLGHRLKVKKGVYTKYYEYHQAGDKLTPVTQNDYAGIRLLQTANLLAPVAGKSAVVVPTPKQIEEYLKKRR